MLQQNKYKLIAFDIDGTILDNNHQVCKKLIEVVAKLKQKGFLFTLVSARMPQSVITIAKELGIDNQHIVALNGSLVTDNHHDILYNKNFPLGRVRDTLMGLDTQVSRNYYNTFDWFMEYPNLFTQNEILSMDNRVLPKIGEVPQDVNKITLVGEADLLANAQAKLVQDDSLLVSFSHTHYLEITCNTISKFNGLAYYADKLSIPIAQVIAFGDGENDIPMLSGVGLGVAMGNAKEHVKAAAKDVAGNNYEEGVANYLSKLFL